MFQHDGQCSSCMLRSCTTASRLSSKKCNHTSISLLFFPLSRKEPCGSSCKPDIPQLAWWAQNCFGVTDLHFSVVQSLTRDGYLELATSWSWVGEVSWIWWWYFCTCVLFSSKMFTILQFYGNYLYLQLGSRDSLNHVLDYIWALTDAVCLPYIKKLLNC